MSEEFEVPELSDDPTPDERAEFVILRFEQFIRDGRKVAEGMSFNIWQSMAKTEIAIAISETELGQQKEEAVTKRLLFTFAAALVTVGFWGTAVSVHKVGYVVGGIICFVAGLVLMGVAGEWRFRKWNKKRQPTNVARPWPGSKTLNAALSAWKTNSKKKKSVCWTRSRRQ